MKLLQIVEKQLKKEPNFVTDNGVNQVEVMVGDPDNVEQYLVPIMTEAGQGMAVSTWKDRNSTFFNSHKDRVISVTVESITESHTYEVFQ